MPLTGHVPGNPSPTPEILMPLFSRNKDVTTDPDDYSGGPGVKDYTDQPDEQRLAPDDPRKPAAPTDLGKRTWLGVAKRAFSEFKDDNITDWAAALTYYAVLSMFPGVIVFVSLLGLFGQGPDTVEQADQHRRGHRRPARARWTACAGRSRPWSTSSPARPGSP